VALPDWVPEAARHYLEHTENGVAIRALARREQVHASTILRQVRRYEGLRDDPLVDEALRQLSRCLSPQSEPADQEVIAMPTDPSRRPVQRAIPPQRPEETPPSEAHIDREALRVLRRLTETGAVLAVAREMEMGVVVRDGPDGAAQRTAVVTRDIAQAMALRDWIGCADPTARIARYHITSAGRAALKRLMAQAENRAQGMRAEGFAEDQSVFAAQHRDMGGREVLEDGLLRHMRANMAESPLAGLARRKDRDGNPFLARDLVAAGERLREDFELSHLGPRVTQDWDGFLTGRIRTTGETAGGGGGGAEAARRRVAAALADLGPGLGDVVLRCCCFLEGMEVLEQRMGWSARSGKIVLRIALQRLKRHYEETQGKFGPKIG